MFRILGLVALVGIGTLVAAMGGRIGPYSLTEIPPLLLAFAAVTALVLLGLRSI